jgi:hypothetical protein
MEKMAKISHEQHAKLKEIKRLYGIPLRVLLDKAIDYACDNKKRVWEVR